MSNENNPIVNAIYGTAFEILTAIIKEHHIDTVDRDTIFCALDSIESDISSDFTLEFDGNEYRIISDTVIWGVFVETIKDIVTDCYDLKLDKFPDFIAVEIDWEQTAKNAYSDGYGHTFSPYDRSEIEVVGYHVFRTN